MPSVLIRIFENSRPQPQVVAGSILFTKLPENLYLSSGCYGHPALIGGCWKQPLEPMSEPTTADLPIAAVGGTAPH